MVSTRTRARVATMLALFLSFAPPQRGGGAEGMRTPTDQIIAAMSTEEKIGQLLLVGFDGHTLTSELRRMVVEWRVGGVVLYRPNIASTQTVRELNRAILHAAPRVEPFLAIDHEGGLVQRLDAAVPQIPSAMAIGATRSTSLSRRAGNATATALRDLGFTMNFAPVLDVLGSDENPALLTRGFSDDPELVARLGAAFAQGTWDAGVVPVGKHYPGQGRTTVDSHYDLPVIAGTIDRLRRHDLRPFVRAFARGMPAVMTAHVALPDIAETPRTPATLSRRLLTDLLRRELRFDGVVMTDELQMGSVRAGADPGEVAIKAILAGADMIMVVWSARDRESVRTALLEAHATGRITKTRLHESVRRILELKRRISSAEPSREDDSGIASDIARRSVTVLHGSGLPVRDSADLAILGPDGPLRRQFPLARWFGTPPRVDDEITRQALSAIGNAHTIIAIQSGVTDARLAAAVRIHLPERRFIVVSLGSPWRATVRPAATTTVLAYSDVPASQNAAADVLIGRIAAAGRLPVNVRDLE